MRVTSLVIPSLLLAGALPAQQPTPSSQSTTKPDSTATRSARRDSTAARRDTARKLVRVMITAPVVEQTPINTLQRLNLPASTGITANKAELTVNLVDPQDAVKYLPSIYMRKRNNGDTQATMQTRVWGVGSSARSLVFADGVPLSALIANNNTIGGPKWGLVSPEEIARVDVMYGPYSAAYAGNSMGAVMEITTRMPERREGSITQTHAIQSFNLYGTDDTY